MTGQDDPDENLFQIPDRLEHDTKHKTDLDSADATLVNKNRWNQSILDMSFQVLLL